MSATEATVAVPAEEVKAVETTTAEPAPAPATEAPATEQLAPPAEEAAPAAVRLLTFFSMPSHSFFQEAPKEEEAKAAVCIVYTTSDSI